MLQQAVKIPPLRRSFPLSYGSRRESVQQSLPSSINRYVDNILCTEREKMCPEIKRLLTFLSDNCEDQTFKVEELNCVSKKICLFLLDFFGHKYVLQQIVLNFMDKLYVYPLDNTTFPERPGVYFIYHVSKTQLYDGRQVSPSTRYPFYGGMSQKSIADRLKDHRNNNNKILLKIRNISNYISFPRK